MTRAEQLKDIKEILLSELNYRVECGEMSKDNSLFEMLEGNNFQALKGLYRRLFGYGYEY
jgi:hypothetical protein|nr:MAG TPA: hypothetical protein [Caudoviricetes sp.]